MAISVFKPGDAVKALFYPGGEGDLDTGVVEQVGGHWLGDQMILVRRNTNDKLEWTPESMCEKIPQEKP